MFVHVLAAVVVDSVLTLLFPPCHLTPRYWLPWSTFFSPIYLLPLPVPHYLKHHRSKHRFVGINPKIEEIRLWGCWDLGESCHPALISQNHRALPGPFLLSKSASLRRPILVCVGIHKLEAQGPPELDNLLVESIIPKDVGPLWSVSVGAGTGWLEPSSDHLRSVCRSISCWAQDPLTSWLKPIQWLKHRRGSVMRLLVFRCVLQSFSGSVRQTEFLAGPLLLSTQEL